MKTLITTIAAAALMTMVSYAEEKPPGRPPGGGPGGPPGGGPGGKRPNPEEVFKKLDANNDGSVSLDEFKAGPRGKEDPERAQEVFGKIDADSSGGISADEFKAHRPPHGAGGPPPGGKGG